ncbi:MAG: PAS domain-containing protein [Alphaproteobacteria bacterium]|nr:PAS domain-containing protein [Alphaproteobacteria bacterium]
MRRTGAVLTDLRTTNPNLPPFLAGGGAMGAMIAGHDWSGTLGPVEAWPQSLKSVVGLMVHSPVPLVLLWGPDGIMIYNDGYSVFAGGRHPRLLGSKVLEGWPEAADLNRLVMKTGLAGDTLSYKDRELSLNRRGTFEPCWVDLDYSPVMDESGKPAGVIAVVVETTERVLAERTAQAERERLAQSEAVLRDNEARLRFLDALGKETAKSLDADAILATTTRMVGEELGVSICAYADMDADEDGFTIRGDWSAPGSSSIVGHYSLSDFGKLAVEKLHAGEPLIISDNQKELPLEESATFQAIGISATICMPLVKEGSLTALMAIHDKSPREWTANELALIGEVTERSWAHIERARVVGVMRASENQFRTMAQAMPNHVWTAAPDGLLDWFNSRVYAYSKAAPGTLDGTGWTSMVHPDDLGAAAASWASSLAAGETYETEFRLKRADGQYRWHIARAIPIRDSAGKLVRWIGTNTDIHDQKTVAETLEQRVHERTSELEQAQEALRQAQKMEAVGQLTGGIAHDFNNLLQGITGALDRVQHRIGQGRVNEVDRFLKAAIESANRAAALTHRLLAFSRRQTLDPRPVDANRLIGGMEDLVRRTMGPNVSVEVVDAGGLWPVRVDPSQLENSLLNLCINARDAMPEGGKLTIETANKWLDERAARDRELPPGQYVSLCVTDTGAGMTPDVIARVFDPFFTTKPLGQGTGLGLSMIYGFVRQSGGQVRIYSEPGQGTTMCLYFPRHMGELQEDAGETSEMVERGFGETVLVVDDKPTVRMLVAEVLSESYYNIIEAGDGPSALKVLETSRRIDLMITDVGLPGGMNGRQVADAARVLRKDLKVLFITGYAENAAVGNGQLDAGMEILAKPFAMSTLANKVREMIER